MFDFSREVFVCKCSTNVRDDAPDANEDVGRMRFVSGGERDLLRLGPPYHDANHIKEMRERLDRGEYWMIGELDGEIVTYTFLVRGPEFRYTYLPGCAFLMREDTAYGYGAWTPDHFRGRGFRRRAFLEELRILRSWGKKWEARVFIKQQMEGAKRSLALVGIEPLPLWRVEYVRTRKLKASRLGAPDDDCVLPLFTVEAPDGLGAHNRRDGI
jgi:hypothetical protein